MSYLKSPELKDRIAVIFKIFWGYSKLTKREKKLVGIMRAENKEYLVWHQGPELAE